MRVNNPGFGVRAAVSINIVPSPCLRIRAKIPSKMKIETGAKIIGAATITHKTGIPARTSAAIQAAEVTR